MIKTYDDEISEMFQDDIINNKKRSSISITFQVTDNCNLACTYCYQINKGKHVMPLSVAQKFIDMLLENNEYTKQYIDTENTIACILDFIGGEPLLEIDLIDDIIQYFVKRAIELNHPWQYNYRVSICSNGVLYNTEKVQKFMQKYRNILSFSISIDGNKELHDSCRVFPDGSGSYDIAIAGVQHFRENFYDVPSTKMTIAPGNVNYLYDAIINLIDIGYKDISLNCVFEEGWTTEHASIMYKELTKIANYLLDNDLEDKIYLSIFDERLFCPKDPRDDTNWCGGNGKMLALDWKGDIYPCLRYMESSLGNEVSPYIIGNVNDGLNCKPEHQKCVECLQKVNRLTQSTQECIDCPIAEGCAWCQAYNYQASGGDINKRATYICIMHQSRALANAYYWNLKYWKHDIFTRMKIWLPDEKALQIIDEKELNFLKLLQYPIE